MPIFGLTVLNQEEVPTPPHPHRRVLSFKTTTRKPRCPVQRSHGCRETRVLLRGLTRIPHHRLLQAGYQDVSIAAQLTRGPDHALSWGGPRNRRCSAASLTPDASCPAVLQCATSRKSPNTAKFHLGWEVRAPQIKNRWGRVGQDNMAH